MYHAIAILAQLVEQGISNAQVVGSSPIDGINRSEVNFKIMAFKGTAGKSSSGASMSQYDVEVEGRLKKLEAAVAALEKHSHDVPAPTAGGVDPRVDLIISHLRKKEDITDITG